MTGREIYEVWALASRKWKPWVRPVPFVVINDEFTVYTSANLKIPEIQYTKNILEDTAIIVDLPGIESIREGLALAKIGYSPVPIYNGTIEQEGAIATTDNKTVITGLMLGAFELNKIQTSEKEIPVFLLDTNRMNRLKMNISVFDNSWDIYDQDIPSAEYFIKNGINKIIIRSDKIQRDLNKILYKFQEKGIQILFTQGYDNPKKVKIKKTVIKEKD